MRVLLIEDDDQVANPLVEGLTRFGFTVERARTGAEGLAAGETDMVLLDLGLPDMDGTDVCRALRLRSQVPVIMISARSDEVDRILGRELGADGYLSKPFGVRELVARIRAVARRTRPAGTGTAAATAPPRRKSPTEPRTESRPRSPAVGTQRTGPPAIDRRGRQVRLHQRPVALSPKEFDLLVHLAGDPGAVHTRRQILDAAWEPHYFGPAKTLDVHIAALRRRLGDSAWIDTVRGVGFRLTPPADPEPAAPSRPESEGDAR